MNAEEFEQLVESDVRSRNLIPEGARVLAAVSGGPDSVCLLLALMQLAARLGLEVRAAHYNHAIRPSAVEDEAFVRDLCAQLSVEAFFGRSRTLGAGASEEAARDERLAFLEQTARASSCEVIATGHTADDRVETVLLNVLRGTGLTGIQGIRWRSGVFARPLLGRGRDEILSFLEERRQPYRTDESNTDLVYQRNRVRLRLLPFLEDEFGKHVRGALARLAETAGEESALLDDLARQLLQHASRPSPDDTTALLDSRVLMEAPPPLALRAVRLALGDLLGGLRDVTLPMCRRIVEAARAPAPRQDIGLMVYAFSDSSTVTVGLSVPEPVPESFDLPVPRRGEIVLPQGGWVIRSTDVGEHVTVEPHAFRLALRSPDCPLRVRSWRAGDRMRPKGLVGSRKLQDIFSDAKLPRRQRHLLPLVCSRDDILWAPGLAVSEDAQTEEPDLLLLIFRPA